jgi:hypothetical protein
MKDRNGMTVIDYGFLGHRYVVGEYVRGIISLIGSNDLFVDQAGEDDGSKYSAAKKGIFDLKATNNDGSISFPKLVHVHMTTTRKPESVIVEEKKYLEDSVKKISVYGGDQMEFKQVDYTPYEVLKESNPEELKPYTNLLSDDLGKETLEKMNKLVGELKDWSSKNPDAFFSTIDYGFPVEYVDTEEKLIQTCSDLRKEKILCFDVEFTGLESQDLPKTG